jgi:hypothetical protein
MNCLHCQAETLNPKFCSRSCAATYNNIHFPKQKTKKICLVCSESVLSHKHNRCAQHWKEYQHNLHRNKTIGEYRNKVSVKGKHPSWIHSHIRSFARSWLRDLVDLPCAHCGYDKHVELAHIKAVSEFDDSILLSEVNSKENVIQLCPNCHWEFDNLPRA